MLVDYVKDTDVAYRSGAEDVELRSIFWQYVSDTAAFLMRAQSVIRLG